MRRARCWWRRCRQRGAARDTVGEVGGAVDSNTVIARSEATKQSTLSLRGEMDCFAPLAMTAEEAAQTRKCLLSFRPCAW